MQRRPGGVPGAVVPAAAEREPRGRASGRAATGLPFQVWRDKVTSLPEGPGPCSGPAARAAHPPPQGAPPTRHRPRDSGLQPPAPGAGGGARERRARAAGSRLRRNRGTAGKGKRGQRAGPTGPQDGMQPFPAAATRRQARPFRSAKTAKTATAPTYSTQARPQAPVAYRNEATPKRGRKPRKKPIRSLRGGATR